MAGLTRRWRQLIDWLTKPSDAPSSNVRKTVLVRDLTEGRSFSALSLLGVFVGAHSTFVEHAALLADDRDLPGSIPVLHMGPPLVSALNEDCVLPPDLAFSFALDEPQKTKIERWAARIAEEKGPLDKRRYIIDPAVKPERSERGRIKYHRFSCAGYAFEAFRQIDITLCDCGQLPLASQKLLNIVYDDLPSIMDRPKLRKYYGIGDDPPWPVLLPAYLFHGAETHAQNEGSAFKVPHVGYANYPAGMIANE